MNCRVWKEIAVRSKLKKTQHDLNDRHHHYRTASKLHSGYPFNIELAQVSDCTGTDGDQTCGWAFNSKATAHEDADDKTTNHGGEYTHGSRKTAGLGNAQAQWHRQ